jgi:Spy/CpxP family protein refolding chaperone
MKRVAWIIATLVAVLVGAIGFAGYHPGSSFTHGRFTNCLMEKFADKLELNNQQKDELTQIVEEVKGKHQEMHPMRAGIKKEIISELRNQEIDRNKVDSLYNDAKERIDEMYDFLVSRFLEFHKTLTPEQREKLVEEMEKHHERHRRFHHRWEDES